MEHTGDRDHPSNITAGDTLLSTGKPFASAVPSDTHLIRQNSRPPSRDRVVTSRGSQYASPCPRSIRKSKQPKKARSSRLVRASSDDTSSNEYLEVQHRLILKKDIEISDAKHQLKIKNSEIEKQRHQIASMSKDIEKLDASLAFLARVYQDSQGTIAMKDEHLASLEKTRKSLEDGVKQLEATGVKNEEAKLALEVKMKRIGASIKGLCNDHNSLRDNARRLESRRNELDSDKQTIRDTLAAVRAEHEANDARSRQLISKYREHIETLKQTIATLRQELEKGPADLDIAHEKNCHLEAELARVVASHDKLRDENTQGHDEVSGASLCTAGYTNRFIAKSQIEHPP